MSGLPPEQHESTIVACLDDLSDLAVMHGIPSRVVGATLLAYAVGILTAEHCSFAELSELLTESHSKARAALEKL